MHAVVNAAGARWPGVGGAPLWLVPAWVWRDVRFDWFLARGLWMREEEGNGGSYNSLLGQQTQHASTEHRAQSFFLTGQRCVW